MNNITTKDDLIKLGYHCHHTSYHAGYQSVKGDSITEYHGKFGNGYVVYSHNPNSTRFCFISYYIKGE